ncbi:MAG: hypothetical protein LBN95_09610 [Prevotellaceae bacterium]|nr:hypothetical protein [Prevotellaceae bacterium]
MKNLVFIGFLLLSVPIFAQENDLNFDKRFINCEERWVAVQQNNENSYLLGFVFIDENGLNLGIEGNFSIDENGDYLLQKNLGKRQNIKLEPDNQQVALIPIERFSELDITTNPDWFRAMRKIPTVQSFCNAGFIHNKWNNCYSALIYLKLAEDKGAKSREFFSEIIYSYNCLGDFTSAAEIGAKGVKKFPDDAVINREVIFAQANAGLATDAAKTCKKAMVKCTDRSYNGENCYNVLRAFYKQKDVKNFKSWLKSAKKFNSNNPETMNFIAEMEETLRAEIGGEDFF